MESKRKKRGGIAAVTVGVAALVASACGGGAATNEPIDFGYVGWPEAIAKTNIAETVVQALGYETTSTELQVPTIFQGLETGDVDVFVEAWFPTMQPILDNTEPGSVKSVVVNMPEATYSLAVNKPACDAGVTSHEDLAEHEEEFRGEIYGIEPGNDGNIIVQEMIDNDTYGLGGWELIESSTSAMLAEVDSRSRNDEWIVFTGWEPHWMGQKYDMCLLEDPEMMWGESSRVETLATASLEENEELWQFFEQMTIDQDTQATWIDMIDNSGMEPEEVALTWLRDNPETTRRWLEGVETVDGEDGFEALQEHLENQ
ncbi:ABC-type proline/glycine betaine transport systems periplasmic component [Rubrobacter radiotolerans]|uniref:ABC-type proline/glycine betaine transport systems periplasmic component n=1 Tax=Rubrobacter radiotolerans TaxID=42256 RepID=A0A023WZT2_RUBRA|nr:glycine betaine ABC transporter substrate-binding protein [Rubrobacter radiotolerans]AHY45324.1 ABC-type proline/glycine betaine transport systems periplasmic component [Rubrobacter radiotolerans]MDX5892736.1 glycine betaine ABC transporter substrate-binding protein [Rubrobacter radiotolerans]SMC02386.1 glycine betaine/proline transport system substrate-binding protein [Rubrobacter radiotolerans DSM 5868]